jgi:prepilin-type N-terminal cleavage/methylation domain-containing protein
MDIYNFSTSLFKGFSSFFKKGSHRFLAAKNPKFRRDRYAKSLGFTLIEVLVVMIIVGILSAIAAPSWLAFANNQRINASQTKIFQAIKVAQSDAKIRSNNNARTRITFTFPTTGDSTFRLDNVRTNGGIEQPLEQGMIIASVTRGTTTTTPADPPPVANALTSPVSIEFDSRGFLYDPDQTLTLPICINLSTANTPAQKAKKWIKLQTLLGAVTTGVVESESSICYKSQI